MTGDYPSLAAGFGKQYVTATNAYEAIQMAKALHGKQSLSLGVLRQPKINRFMSHGS